MVMTSWVRCRRMRLATIALPDCGESRKVATPGCGLDVATMWMALTWSLSVIGLSTLMEKGTVLPFSAISGSSTVILPSIGLASPRILRTACSQACGWSCASGVATGSVPTTVAAPAPSVNSRRLRLSLWKGTFRLAAVVSYIRYGRQQSSHTGLLSQHAEHLGLRIANTRRHLRMGRSRTQRDERFTAAERLGIGRQQM